MHIARGTTRIRWTQSQMNTVFFMDESRFHMNFLDGGACLERRNERFHPENAIQRNRYGGGSVMI
jgi:hypothetical protein